MQISNKEGSMQKMVNLVATTVVVCSGIMLASGCESNASQKAATIESEVLQLALVKNNGASIKRINNPSEEVQLAAVKENPGAIAYIKNPSENVQVEAIKKGAYALK